MFCLSKIFVADTFLVSLRVLEFSLSVVFLGLIGYTNSTFNDEKTNFALATAAISLFYIIDLYASVIFFNKYIVTIFAAFWENSLVLLWMCTFFVTAKHWGSKSCSNIYDSKKCKTAQASIAFAAVEFFLFLWTALVFDFQIIAAIITDSSKAADIFKSNRSLSIKYNRLHGCSLINLISDKSVEDLEGSPIEELETSHLSSGSVHNDIDPEPKL
ncbi:hypothetical protein QEN19_000774 [Hanseniaspora menglaensis]